MCVLEARMASQQVLAVLPVLPAHLGTSVVHRRVWIKQKVHLYRFIHSDVASAGLGVQKSAKTSCE